MLNKPSLWRRSPPGIIPICLALLGLSLVRRNAAADLPVSPDIGDALTAMAAAVYLFFLSNYLRKPMTRPGVLLEDTVVPPARAGISTIALTMQLSAGGLSASTGNGTDPDWRRCCGGDTDRRYGGRDANHPDHRLALLPLVCPDNLVSSMWQGRADHANSERIRASRYWPHRHASILGHKTGGLGYRF